MKNNTENENKKFLPKEDEIIVNRTISFDNKCFINYINNYEKTRIIFKNNFLLVLLIYFLFTLNINDLFYYKEIDGNEIFQKGTKNYLKLEIINKFNSFISKCNNNLNNVENYSIINEPKISVIMPIYNGGKYLSYSLISIQNQNMKDIEIILIDDNSSDNSLTIIQEHMKKDLRIKLIKNDKNKKILYSKSIAALNSKGEYIIELDQDDMFIREDVFQILYSESKVHDLELVQMRDFYKEEFYFNKKTLVNNSGLHFIYSKSTHYKSQPELKDKIFEEKNNYLLWGLLIKTDLYKKAIYNLWPFIMNYQIIFNEDYIITTMIAKLAKNYKYINKFGLIHLRHSNSISNNYAENKEFYLSLLFYVYYLYEYYLKKNQKNINLIINFIRTNIHSFKKAKNLFPKMFYFISKVITNNKYLSDKNKLEIFHELKISINKYKQNIAYDYIIDKIEFDNIYNFQNMIKNKGKACKLYDKLFKISIIIYCTGAKLLNQTIFSILNQIEISYEVLIIYDNYKDINLNYIKKTTSEFENIKIFNNNRNKGLLYSYSLGVLNAKGEYIIFLQPGYTLAKENTLSIIYNSAKIHNLDILEFNLLINTHENLEINSLYLYKCLHFQSNKDMNILKSDKGSKDIELDKELFFNKLIKTNIYQKIVNKYELTKLNIAIYIYYDNILYYLFNKYKLKFKHIDEFGVVKNIYNVDINDYNNIINESIFYINFIFDNSKNTFLDKKKVYLEFVNILNVIYNKFTNITNNSNKLIEKFINCISINKKEKDKLQFFYNSLIN